MKFFVAVPLLSVRAGQGNIFEDHVILPWYPPQSIVEFAPFVLELGIPIAESYLYRFSVSKSWRPSEPSPVPSSTHGLVRDVGALWSAEAYELCRFKVAMAILKWSYTGEQQVALTEGMRAGHSFPLKALIGFRWQPFKFVLATA